MVEHLIQVMKEKDGREIKFLDGKRITAFTKEEAFCDAEVTLRKYPELFGKACMGDEKSINILKGKIIQESDRLIQPEHAQDFLQTKINQW